MLNLVLLTALTVGCNETIELPVVAIVAAPVRIVRDVQPVRSVIRSKPARRVAARIATAQPVRRVLAAKPVRRMVANRPRLVGRTVVRVFGRR